MNRVLAKYCNIDYYTAQYIIDLANGKYLKMYWKQQFSNVLHELKHKPIINLYHFSSNNNYIHITYQGMYDFYDLSHFGKFCDDVYYRFYNNIYMNFKQSNRYICTRIWKYARKLPKTKYFHYENVQYNCFGIFFAEDDYDFENGIYSTSYCDVSYAYYQRFFIPKILYLQ